ncbi:Uncharacterised protein [Mycobacteroides abscessus subsp. massiliense]|nr:Uncharacterised protein [Mycobacteroides abscessus subsp. massiliense]
MFRVHDNGRADGGGQPQFPGHVVGVQQGKTLARRRCSRFLGAATRHDDSFVTGQQLNQHRGR